VLLLYSLQSNQSACELQVLMRASCPRSLGRAQRAGTRRSQCPDLSQRALAGQPDCSTHAPLTQGSSSLPSCHRPPTVLPCFLPPALRAATTPVRKRKTSKGGVRRFGSSSSSSSSSQPRTSGCTHERINHPRSPACAPLRLPCCVPVLWARCAPSSIAQWSSVCFSVSGSSASLLLCVTASICG
jgi:hypothetical protein